MTFYFKKNRLKLSYLLLLILLSVSYLVVELAFSARLLDAVWSAQNIDDIKGIEHYGRLISGVAVWLAIFGIILFPKFAKRMRVLEEQEAASKIEGVHSETVVSDTYYRKKRTSELTKLLIRSVLWGAIILPLVYVGQKSYVDYLVSQSTAEERRNAMYISTLSLSFQNNSVQLDGLTLPEDNVGSLKAFSGLLPALGLSTNQLTEKIDKQLRSIIIQNVKESLGSPEKIYNNAFAPSVKSLKESYNEYVNGVNSYFDILNGIRNKQKKEWESYRLRVKQQTKKYPEQIKSRFIISKVRNHARKELKGLPKNWNITDRNTFYRIVKRDIETKAKANFHANIKKIVGRNYKNDLEPGLSWAKFQKHKSVYKNWREQLTFIDSKYSVYPSMSFSDFKNNFYVKKVNSIADVKINEMKADINEFKDGGKYFDIGESAIERTVVPPIALLFSLIGAVFHFLKLFNFLLMVVVPYSSLRIVLASIFALYIAYSPMKENNPITNSELYKYFYERISENHSEYYASALTWIIHFEGVIYPINEKLRTTVLQGLEFGYKEQ